MKIKKAFWQNPQVNASNQKQKQSMHTDEGKKMANEEKEMGDLEKELLELQSQVQTYYLEHPEKRSEYPDKIFVKSVEELEEKITEHIPKKVVEDEIVEKRIVDKTVVVGESPLDFSLMNDLGMPKQYVNSVFQADEEEIEEDVDDQRLRGSEHMEDQGGQQGAGLSGSLKDYFEQYMAGDGDAGSEGTSGQDAGAAEGGEASGSAAGAGSSGAAEMEKKLESPGAKAVWKNRVFTGGGNTEGEGFGQGQLFSEAEIDDGPPQEMSDSQEGAEDLFRRLLRENAVDWNVLGGDDSSSPPQPQSPAPSAPETMPTESGTSGRGGSAIKSGGQESSGPESSEEFNIDYENSDNGDLGGRGQIPQGDSYNNRVFNIKWEQDDEQVTDQGDLGSMMEYFSQGDNKSDENKQQSLKLNQNESQAARRIHAGPGNVQDEGQQLDESTTADNLPQVETKVVKTQKSDHVESSLRGENHEGGEDSDQTQDVEMSVGSEMDGPGIEVSGGNAGAERADDAELTITLPEEGEAGISGMAERKPELKAGLSAVEEAGHTDMSSGGVSDNAEGHNQAEADNGTKAVPKSHLGTDGGTLGGGAGGRGSAEAISSLPGNGASGSSGTDGAQTERDYGTSGAQGLDGTDSLSWGVGGSTDNLGGSEAAEGTVGAEMDAVGSAQGHGSAVGNESSHSNAEGFASGGAAGYTEGYNQTGKDNAAKTVSDSGPGTDGGTFGMGVGNSGSSSMDALNSLLGKSGSAAAEEMAEAEMGNGGSAQDGGSAIGNESSHGNEEGFAPGGATGYTEGYNQSGEDNAAKTVSDSSLGTDGGIFGMGTGNSGGSSMEALNSLLGNSGSAAAEEMAEAEGFASRGAAGYTEGYNRSGKDNAAKTVPDSRPGTDGGTFGMGTGNSGSSSMESLNSLLGNSGSAAAEEMAEAEAEKGNGSSAQGGGSVIGNESSRRNAEGFASGRAAGNTGGYNQSGKDNAAKTGPNSGPGTDGRSGMEPEAHGRNIGSSAQLLDQLAEALGNVGTGHETTADSFDQSQIDNSFEDSRQAEDRGVSARASQETGSSESNVTWSEPEGGSTLGDESEVKLTKREKREQRRQRLAERMMREDGLTQPSEQQADISSPVEPINADKDELAAGTTSQDTTGVQPVGQSTAEISGNTAGKSTGRGDTTIAAAKDSVQSLPATAEEAPGSSFVNKGTPKGGDGKQTDGLNHNDALPGVSVGRQETNERPVSGSDDSGSQKSESSHSLGHGADITDITGADVHSSADMSTQKHTVGLNGGGGTTTGAGQSTGQSGETVLPARKADSEVKMPKPADELGLNDDLAGSSKGREEGLGGGTEYIDRITETERVSERVRNVMRKEPSVQEVVRKETVEVPGVKVDTGNRMDGSASTENQGESIRVERRTETKVEEKRTMIEKDRPQMTEGRKTTFPEADKRQGMERAIQEKLNAKKSKGQLEAEEERAKEAEMFADQLRMLLQAPNRPEPSAQVKEVPKPVKEVPSESSANIKEVQEVDTAQSDESRNTQVDDANRELEKLLSEKAAPKEEKIVPTSAVTGVNTSSASEQKQSAESADMPIISSDAAKDVDALAGAPSLATVLSGIASETEVPSGTASMAAIKPDVPSEVPSAKTENKSENSEAPAKKLSKREKQRLREMEKKKLKQEQEEKIPVPVAGEQIPQIDPEKLEKGIHVDQSETAKTAAAQLSDDKAAHADKSAGVLQESAGTGGASGESGTQGKQLSKREKQRLRKLEKQKIKQERSEKEKVPIAGEAIPVAGETVSVEEKVPEKQEASVENLPAQLKGIPLKEKKVSFWKRMVEKLSNLFRPSSKKQRPDVIDTIQTHSEVQVEYADGLGNKLEGVVEGDVRGESIILDIRSIIKSDVVVTDCFHCKQKSNVLGNVYAKKVIVEGTITGNVQALQSIEIKAGGCVLGNVQAPSIRLDVKGYIAGNLTYEKGDMK